MRLRYSLLTALTLLVCGSFSYAQQTISIEKVSTFSTGKFDESAAEIAVYDSMGRHIYFTNAQANLLTILSVDNMGVMTKVKDVDLNAYGGGVNSVAAYNGLIAVAEQNDNPQDSGMVIFFDQNGEYINKVMVGAMPDMVTFTKKGEYLLSANEGEPNDEYTIDPQGSVSIINLQGGAAGLTQMNVKHATFTSFNGGNLDKNVRIFGPNATVGQDLEPEYISISPDNTRAYVTLQENNAIATIDIATAQVVGLRGLGYKDFSEAGNGIDASDKSSSINITPVPVFGMYQPDGIASYMRNGVNYLITANEGDARDYDGYSEVVRVKDLKLDDTYFPNASTIQLDDQIGRLNVTVTLGDSITDDRYERLYAFGARSFSIWNAATGIQVYDSGDDMEQIIAQKSDAQFNSTNTDNSSRKSRSDDKGPEPEAVTLAMVDTMVYAFIGLERQGGVMMFDVTDPFKANFITYFNNRNFGASATSANAGDLGIESIQYIPAALSPTGDHLLVTAHEISGTVSIYKINGIGAGSGIKKGFSATPDWTYYPNPMQESGTLTISTKGTYRLLDNQGRLLSIYPNTRQIDMSTYGKGIYFLQDTQGRMAKIVR